VTDVKLPFYEYPAANTL